VWKKAKSSRRDESDCLGCEGKYNSNGGVVYRYRCEKGFRGGQEFGIPLVIPVYLLIA